MARDIWAEVDAAKAAGTLPLRSPRRRRTERVNLLRKLTRPAKPRNGGRS